MELQQCCFKIDSANAKAMIEGVPAAHGKVVHQCIWLDVKTKSFPMLVTLNKTPSRFGPQLSPVGVQLNSHDYQIDNKYIACLEAEFFIKNDMSLWETVCKNGLFNIWSPDAPYSRFSSSKSQKDKYRICLLRLYEVHEAFSSDDIVAVTHRIDHLISSNKNVTIKGPVLDDESFEDVKKLVLNSLSPYLTKAPVFYTLAGNATTPSSPASYEKQWTNAEYQNTVDAYVWMLEQEQQGNPYNKSKINKDLRNGPLATRSKPSIEFRMRNISAVLEELCLPWIKGYVPAGNIRGEGKEKIKAYLANAGVYNPEDYAPTDDPDVLDQRVRDLKGKINPSLDPPGNKTPQQTTATTVRFVRSAAVKASVLAKADGICEGCGLPAPFADNYGEPYLEVHHLKQLAHKGSDTVTNAVALCPTCHRRCHHSNDRVIFMGNIYMNVSRLILE